MIIQKDCYTTILLVWLICAPLVYLLMRFIPYPALAYILCVIPVTFMGFSLFFFRVPKRMSVMDKDLVIAPCDGKVVQVRKVEEDEYLKTECYQISIFMSVLNVHVNYYPVSGKIIYSKHHQGAYIVASYPKASVLNERTSIAVETADGAKVLFRQIAGYIARRIVCYAEVGQQATQCSQVGFIKFGSRMDVFIPVTSQVNVKVGDKVRACETVIAKMKK